MEEIADFKTFILALFGCISVFIAMWKFQDNRFQKFEDELKKQNEKLELALREVYKELLKRE